MSKELAIISKPGFGLQGAQQVCLRFTVHLVDNFAADLAFFDGSEVAHIIKSAGVDDVHDLDGKACVVRREAGTVNFVQMHKS